jgi:hypothetical protein
LLKKAAAMTQQIAEIIVFQKRGGVLSKRLHLNADGKLENDSSECRMATGAAARLVLGSIGDLAAFIDVCPSDIALALGQLKGAPGAPVPVFTKRQLCAGAFIHSFAHGRGIYELVPDVAFIRAQLASLTGAQLVKTFAELLACARLDAIEEAELIEWVSDTAKIGKMVVKQQLKDARAAAARLRAQAARVHLLATRTDPRTRMRAPCEDAPWLPEMQAYEAVLLKINAGIPPTRDMDLNLNTLWSTEIPGTHAYSSKGAGEPPAPQLNIARLSLNETANLLETHIDFYKETESGSCSVKRPTCYVEHFQKWEGSAMPMLVAFSQLPLVLADGEILAPRGLDKLRGIAFIIDGELRGRLPSSRVRDETQVAEALDFLLNDWLVDVSCSFADKLNLLALAATIVERSLLPERPVWFVTSPTPESGKTTAVKMVIAAVTGLDAVAFAWSPHDEERRKAILAHLDAGLSHILLDNILDGSVIQCPHVERACTANFYGDRKLGVSEHIRTSAATVFIFTGDNIEPAGAMASHPQGAGRHRPRRPDDAHVQAQLSGGMDQGEPRDGPRGDLHHPARQPDARRARRHRDQDAVPDVVPARRLGVRARGEVL